MRRRSLVTCYRVLALLHSGPLASIYAMRCRSPVNSLLSGRWSPFCPIYAVLVSAKMNNEWPQGLTDNVMAARCGRSLNQGTPSAENYWTLAPLCFASLLQIYTTRDAGLLLSYCSSPPNCMDVAYLAYACGM